MPRSRLRVRAERALQLVRDGDWSELGRRLARKLSRPGPKPQVMTDPSAYGRWRRSAQRQWDALLAAMPMGAEDQLEILRVDPARPLRVSASDARPYVLLLPHDAELDPRWAAAIAAMLGDYSAVYWDDERLVGHGARARLFDPYFKPDFSRERAWADPALLASFAARRSLLTGQVFAAGAPIFAAALAVTDGASKREVAHIPAPLVALRDDTSSPAAAAKVLVAHLRRRRVLAKVEQTTAAAELGRPPPLLVTPQPPRELVSVLIPFRDRPELLEQCLSSLFARTEGVRFEVLLLDNGSEEAATHAAVRRWTQRPRVRVLSLPGPFNFSRLNNAGAQAAKGRFLVLLNNDTEVLSPGWLTHLLGWAAQPDVGVVGARLLYGDDTLQHAGVVLGVGGHTAHRYSDADKDAVGHQRMLAFPHSVSAVTAACCMVGREKYLAVAGLDEEQFAVAFNDVDLCLRLGARGLRTVYEPRAVLFHHESKSRGSRVNSREDRAFARRHGALLTRDPFYNDNLCRLLADYRPRRI